MPTSYATEGTTIEGFLNTNWSHTRVVWPQREYEPGVTEEWVRIDIIPFDSFGTNLGPTVNYRQTGEVWVSVFTPRNKGPARNNALIDLARAVFIDALDSGVHYGVPRREPGTDTTWFQQLLKVPFWWEATS